MSLVCLRPHILRNRCLFSCVLRKRQNFSMSSSRESPKKDGQSLTNVNGDNKLQLSLGKRVKETTKTVWYSGIIVAGIGATAVILYAIFKELFSGDSPQAIYSKAFEKCKLHPRVCDLLGEPIKCFGEESNRGRRRRIKHTSYMKDGAEHLRLQFYIQGIRNQAIVHVDMVKDHGSFKYYYLFVEMENYPREVVIVEDNREFAV